MSTIPAFIPGHIAFFRSEGEVLAAFNRQAAQDWEAFLTLRGRELRPGGRLVILQPARDENGRTGFEELGDHTNNALAEMVEERLITPDEHARMVLGGYVRRKCELLAPFRTNGSYQNLHVESCELMDVPDPAWADCVQDGKSESWAARHALVFRTAFAPSLATALAGTPDDERHRRFGDQLEERLKRRLAARPAPVNMLVTAMVLAKEEANFDE